MKLILDEKIKVAIIGCGRISVNHFNSIKEHNENLQLVSICDTDIEVLEKHKKKYKVNGYQNLEELLVNELVDLVVLCTPSGLHCEQAILSAKFGVNVVTEKPMATRWQDGIEMVKACDNAGVYLFVVKQNK